MTEPVVHVLHENAAWLQPFRAALDAEGVPFVEWELVTGSIDLTEDPPPGVFWSRISASSHTRGHTHSKDYARAVLSWLEAAGRRTVNGRRVLELEVSKVAQLAALRAAGIDVPRTIAVVGDGIADAARRIGGPVIVKHNQGGKGLSVQRFADADEVVQWEAAASDDPPQDGITLVQELLVAETPRITRVEIVGGEFVYAINADTYHGGFQLCPADACAVDPETGRFIVPPGAVEAPVPGVGLFSLRTDPPADLVDAFVAFTRAQGIEVAGIEFIETVDGRRVAYDVNTNTNYNADVEAVAPASAPRQLARFLGGLLAQESARAAVATG
ncbi:MAG: alpha-L-glutamate ligase [Microbacterium ginsengisoli]|uniref:ATP-grasp domain-containing protein n=1 Tax=Microbacterium TaxID=33882 RepID=UPI0006FB309F|nr:MULTISPECIES: alpha-L-glutamate ligase [unclassified Microbacterium]KQR91670.1 alpha-L-glutamate ligase [Microbacterium sp. Leaf347]KQR91704.1 alpha-L-glutamate ligase [Microbacterium sp. Leaf351]MBN9197847.1 alpha-L-glutamate ligase [Microbacterium ginsengisoli]OJU79254.1 MAG: alpha-L-glutamate ligase [Microbacterium sp. 71-23]